MRAVPNARPGSITTAIASPARRLPRRADPEPADATGRWNARQRSSQPSSTSSCRAPPNAARAAASPRRVGVRGELDAAVVLDLLEALREELEQSRARLLGLRRRRPSTETRRQAQRNALFSLSKKPSSSRSVRLLVDVALELLEQAPLLVVEPPRHGDVDEHALVAAAEALEHGHAAARAGRDLARLRPRLNSSSMSPSSVGTVDRRAERGLRHRQIDRREDVVALAHEARVGPHVHEHVEVAGAAAERAGVALAADADALAVVDPRRDLDLERPLLDDAARAVARRCTAARRSGRDRRSARHACGADELAEDAARDLLEPAGAAARRAGDGRRARARRRCRRSARTAPRPGTARRASTPRAASTSSISTSAATSAPRAGARAPAGAEEVVAEERREEVGRGSRSRSRSGVKPPLRRPAWP